MPKIKKYALLVALILPLLASCSDDRKSFSIDSGWKISYSDNSSYAQADFNDASWQSLGDSTKIDFSKVESDYVWIRKTVEIPAQLRGKEVYLGFAKTNAVADVYADGTYVGSKGSLPPNLNIRIEEITDVLIPSNCIHDNKVTLALRVYSCESDTDEFAMSLDNQDQAYFQNRIHNIFNLRIFLVLAAICLFMLIYVITQFVSSKERCFLYYGICLLFICYYFYDLGFDIVLINYNLHRALTRACLPWSMSFMALFIASFFKRKEIKKVGIIMTAIDILIFIAYMACLGKNSAIELLFLVGLAPTFGVIIYGYFVIAKASKERLFGSTAMLVGFVGGSLFAIHDIIFQVIGKNPFVWLQGMAFFMIDISIYVALSQKASSNQKEIIHLADETSKQKDKLTQVFEKAKDVADSASLISNSLNVSVDAVTHSADQTIDKVTQIRSALDSQNKSQNETEKAINNLSVFLSEMTSRFEDQSKLIASTAEKTQEVITVLENAGDGINTAAQFTKGLSGITKTSSNDMNNLLSEMEKVQSSSKEILGVVTTLDDFAQQINLLAMNASIEAAHAGETGKGFAVIAREIKQLASQTSQWSVKIGEIITSVISQIGHSVELSTKVNSSLAKINKDSIQSAKEVGQAYESIREQQALGREISSESRSLTEIAKEMQKSVDEQASFADIVMQNMQKLIEAASEVDKASGEIYSESKSLANESRNLSDLAHKTKESSESLTSLMTQE